MPRPRRGTPAQPFASWNAERDMWELPIQSLLSERSDGFSETWPSSGSMRSGSAYPRPTSERPMDGSASSSLLPTPSASLGSNGGGQPPEKRRRGGHSVQLHDVVEHLATNPEDDGPLRAGTPRRGRHGSADGGDAAAVALLPTPLANEAEKSWVGPRVSEGQQYLSHVIGALLPTPTIVERTAWGPYAAAIARWEAIHGPAPAPTKVGKKGNRKLNPAFSAWMMGAPAGWITDVPGITDNQASHAIGNGVVPHQGAAALRILLDRISRWDDQ